MFLFISLSFFRSSCKSCGFCSRFCIPSISQSSVDRSNSKSGFLDPHKMKNQDQADDSCKKVSILDEYSPLNEKLSTTTFDSSRVALGPGTPNADRENGEAVLNCLSPLTFVSSTPLLPCSEVADLDSSPRTPKEDVFDPFAPGPDALMLAPHGKKRPEEVQSNVSRRLKFNSSLGFQEIGEKDDDDTEVVLQERVLLETICESLFEFILSQQAEEFGGENMPKATGVCGGLNTPTKLPLLNGIAESCPDAPTKLRRSSMNIDMGICRRLEF